MQKENILLTGATGFIGWHLVRYVLKEDRYNIIAIVRKSDNYKNSEKMKGLKVQLAEGNFYEEAFVQNVFKSYPIDYVIHCAALRGSGAGYCEEYQRVNVRGTEVLLEAALSYKVKKFIFCSSVGVFGTIPKEVPASVQTSLSPDNMYHRSKAEAEKKVKEFIDKGLNAVIVRPTITYGDGDDGFPSILTALVRERKLVLSSRDIKIHLVGVKNLAKIFITLIQDKEDNNRVFIAADEQPIVLRELADLIYKYFYDRCYPKLLTVPYFWFYFLGGFFKFIGNDKWNVRVQLLSKDWFYVPTKAGQLSKNEFSETKKEFLKYLETVKKQNKIYE
ncbi:MAG: NAD(P)-dependent oxidoreductase [Candidatus Omnitrophica bacterium]|nr:NAD(P)-dependent oxidoreductase [Candidatus Omnitrophota bacterium]